jgi:hypothetical protein
MRPLLRCCRHHHQLGLVSVDGEMVALTEGTEGSVQCCQASI